MNSDSPSKVIHSSGFLLLQASLVKKYHTSAASQKYTKQPSRFSINEIKESKKKINLKFIHRTLSKVTHIGHFNVIHSLGITTLTFLWTNKRCSICARMKTSSNVAHLDFNLHFSNIIIPPLLMDSELCRACIIITIGHVVATGDA
jgi:hypothetical protein